MDSPISSCAYPGYSLAQLKAKIEDGTCAESSIPKILAEIDRRERVKAGDMSVATAAERLRNLKNGEA